MKTSFGGEDLSDTELFTLASQFYVRLRRITGRVVDAVYIVQNEAYAREIIQLARTERDMELQIMASRLEELIGGSIHNISVPKVPVAVVPEPVKPAPTAVNIPFSVRGYHVSSVPPVEQATTSVDIAAHSADEVAQHYIGALR